MDGGTIRTSTEMGALAQRSCKSPPVSLKNVPHIFNVSQSAPSTTDPPVLMPPVRTSVGGVPRERDVQRVSNFSGNIPGRRMSA